jgi:putative hemolysin
LTQPAPTVTYTAPVTPAVTYVTTPAYVQAPAPVTTYVAPAPAPYVAAPVVPPPTYLSTQAAPAPAYVPPSPYTPVPSYSTYGNGADNPSVTYDADRYDRVAIMTAAANFCAAQGKSSAFSGRTGALVHYDCVPSSDANHAVQAPVYTSVAPVAAPYVVYEYTTGSQTAFDTQAAAYCTAQGRAAVFRSQNGTQITYDCVLIGQQFTAPVYTAAVENVPVAVPTISYSTAGNNQRDVAAPAIRYCGMLGKQPVLQNEYYSNRTYICE